MVASPAPAPTRAGHSGRSGLPGSLGIAICEAAEDAATNDDTKYSLGSVLNHVLLHQTVIGQEAMEQMELAGDYPDIVIGCAGGGTNFAGIAFPFIGEKLRGKEHALLAVEPTACPTLTHGNYAYDFGDTGQLTPLVKMHTLGSASCRPASTPAACAITAWRRWSATSTSGLIEAAPIPRSVLRGGPAVRRSEGIIPAPETPTPSAPPSTRR